MCEEEGREVGKFLYLGQVAWPSVPTESPHQDSIFEHCGQNDRFPFFGPLGQLPAARTQVCPVQDVPLCVCSHHGRQGGRGRCSLVPVQLTTDDGWAEGLTRMWEPTMGPHRRRHHPRGHDRGADEGGAGGVAWVPDVAWQQSAFSTSTEGRGKKVAAARGAVERLNEPGTQVEADRAVVPIGAGATASAETCRAHRKPQGKPADSSSQQSMCLAGLGGGRGPGKPVVVQRHASIARPRDPPV